MKSSANKITRFFIVLLSTIWIFSCGDVDLLDELNDKYQVSIELIGGDGDSPNDLEVWIEGDCNGDGTADDPEDPSGLAGISGLVTITSSSDAPHLVIYSYEVDYIPQDSTLWTGGTDTPPNLDSPELLELSADVPPGVPTNIDLPTIMTTDTKRRYASLPLGFGQFYQGIYVVRVYLYGREYERDIVLTVDTVVRLMDINNCD